MAEKTEPKGITFDMQEIQTRLSDFFSASVIKSFPLQVKQDNTKGMAAFYVDNRGVQQRLDDTCVWQNVYKEDPRSTKAILCGISILVITHYADEAKTEPVYEWLTRWDGADNSQIEGTKGGLSGSMRRAAVQWGIGRYLYAVPGLWLPMKEGTYQPGKAKYFKETPRIPHQFLPEGEAQRAKKVASEPAQKTASSTTTKKAAKSAGNKLSAPQAKKFKAASIGKDRDAVKAIYEQVITGKLTAAKATAEVNALPTI